MFKSVEPTEKQKAARLAMIEALKSFDLPPMEMLAVMAYTTGQLIAMQDQRKVTPDMAMELVATNIEAGNAHAIAGLLDTKGSG